MRTVLTSKIDGFDIVDGFGSAVHDREATISALIPVMKETDESKAVEDKRIEINAIITLANDALIASKTEKIQEIKEVAFAKYRNHLATVKMKSKGELLPLHKVAGKKYEELWISEHAIYFQPKLGEFLESDLAITITDLSANYPLPVNKLLSLDGTLVDDLRGARYWEKGTEWVGTDILQIGVAIPVGGIRGEDLISAQIAEIELQFETARVALLTTEEKLAEKTRTLELAAIEAERLFNQYTIQATADPLGESQAWLETETARIEAKYA